MPHRPLVVQYANERAGDLRREAARQRLVRLASAEPVVQREQTRRRFARRAVAPIPAT